MAIILHSKKILFVHISKNGGTAVSEFLQGHASQGDITVMEGGRIMKPAGKEFHTRFHISKHAPAWNFYGWMQDIGRDWEAYRTLAIIRNPEQRVQSVYHMLHAGGQYWGPFLAGSEWWGRFKRCQSIDEFVLSGLYDPDGANWHTRTQRSFVTSPDNRIVVSDLLPMERIDEVPSLLGLDGRVVHINATSAPKVKLGEEALMMLNEKYAVDYALHASVA